MSQIAVVIPYYQRQPGLLVRAIESVSRQRDVPRPVVIVVDDGSPLPAVTELATLAPPVRDRVRVVQQRNQGPGPARNAGLEAVPKDAEWTAFLDSDDVWEEQHLARGLAALRQGYDFFFSDVIREGDPGTHYGLASFEPSAHKLLGDSLYAFTGDFFTANLTESPVCTATVILRNSVLGGVRFWDKPDIWEDLIFWLTVARTTTRVAFDGTLQVRMGKGDITVTEGWKSEKALRNNIAYGRYFADVARRFQLTEPQAALLKRVSRGNRRNFALSVLARLHDGRLSALAELGSYMRRNPAVIADILHVLGREGLHRAFGLRRK